MSLRPIQVTAILAVARTQEDHKVLKLVTAVLKDWVAKAREQATLDPEWVHKRVLVPATQPDQGWKVVIRAVEAAPVQETPEEAAAARKVTLVVLPAAARAVFKLPLSEANSKAESKANTKMRVPF